MARHDLWVFLAGLSVVTVFLTRAGGWGDVNPLFSLQRGDRRVCVSLDSIGGEERVMTFVRGEMV